MAGVAARRRTARRSVLLCGALALLLATALVWHSAYAGFADSTAPGRLPTVNTATLTLADDDAGTRLFDVSGLKPGTTGTRCVKVTSTSSLPTVVRLYGTGRSSSNGMSANLSLKVELGTGGSSGSCTGFAPSSTPYNGTLGALPTDSYATGVGPWTTTVKSGGDSRVYRITCTLAAGAPTSVQGGTATITFVWEAQPA